MKGIKNMLEIIAQHEDATEGNNYISKDCVVWMKCHNIHIVMNIRKYIGQGANGLNIRCIREFDDSIDAATYYHDIIDHRNKY